MKLPMDMPMKSATRKGPGSKNVQSSARMRSTGAGQVATGKAMTNMVLKGRANRGM